MIPLVRPLFPSVELIAQYLETSYSSGVWSNFGPCHAHAERRVRELTGKFPVFYTSATTAIQNLLAIQTTESSEFKMPVVVPDFTHAGTICAAIDEIGDRPEIILCDPLTMAMQIERFEDFCNEGYAGSTAIVVNPFGYGIDRKSFVEIADDWGVNLIFDYAGAWGDFDYDDDHPTVYSFHATKSLPIGEGGMILFSSEMQAEAYRRLTNFGTGSDRMIDITLGKNYKLSEVTAAVLCAQLDTASGQYQKILDRIEHKKKLWHLYNTKLKRHMMMSPVAPSMCVFPFPELDPKIFEARAASFGFVAKHYYIPLRKMPAFDHLTILGNIHPELDRCIALPSDCTMEEAETIADDILDFI